MPTPPRRRVGLGVLGGVAVGLLAACGGHSALAAPPTPSSAGSTPPVAASTPVPTPTTAAATTPTAPAPSSTAARPSTSAPVVVTTRPAPPPAACTTAQLTFTLGSHAVSAGRTSVALLLRNTATAPCTVHGWPAVDVVDSTGMQVGPAAAQLAGDAPNGTQPTVTLATGVAATATFSYVAATPASPPSCGAATAAALLVFAPQQSTSRSVPDELELCTDAADRPGITVATADPA